MCSKAAASQSGNSMHAHRTTWAHLHSHSQNTHTRTMISKINVSWIQSIFHPINLYINCIKRIKYKYIRFYGSNSSNDSSDSNDPSCIECSLLICLCLRNVWITKWNKWLQSNSPTKKWWATTVAWASVGAGALATAHMWRNTLNRVNLSQGTHEMCLSFLLSTTHHLHQIELHPQPSKKNFIVARTIQMERKLPFHCIEACLYVSNAFEAVMWSVENATKKEHTQNTGSEAIKKKSERNK